MTALRPPVAMLFDYGGTLVEEVRFDVRAATAWLLEHAELAPGITADHVRDRATRVTQEIANQRDVFNIETPWVSLTRLIHAALGTRFDRPLEELELGFWDAGVETRPMPGVRDALAEFLRLGIPMGVVSNSSYRQHVIRHEIDKHGLAEFMSVVVVTAEYVVRKPNPMVVEAAAGLLGVRCADIWFVGDRIDTDVPAARAAGMTAVLLSPRPDVSAPAPAITVAGWPEIVELVRKARD